MALAGCIGADSEPSGFRDGDPGRLVVIDDSGDVVVMGADGTDRVELSGDDTPPARQAVWAPDGESVAWSQSPSGGSGAGVVVAAVDDGNGFSISTPSQAFYLFWSPDAGALGALYQGSTSLELSVIDVVEESSTVVDKGASFYFAWDPGGSGQLVAHIGEERLEVFDRDGQAVRSLTTSAGYLAPFWADFGILHVDNGSLVALGPEGRPREVAPVSGLSLFVLSPAGERVAIQVLGEGPAVTVSRLEMQTRPVVVLVIDVATGEMVAAHPSPVVGMFWSPDGRSLLLLAPSSEQSNLVDPFVWSDDDKLRFPPFQPSLPMARDLLPFFPQYAQSLNFWSPDSARFAYPGQVEGEPGVWVQALAADVPVRVSDGSWVAWSP